MPKGQQATVNSILAGAGKKKGKGKKGRKIGRYGKHPSSVRYRSERRWETNKDRRMRRHLKRHPSDEQGRETYSKCNFKGGQAFLASIPQPLTSGTYAVVS